jgi:hypothetical protein
MSSISKALMKGRSSPPELDLNAPENQIATGERSDPPSAQVYPVSAVIRNSSRRRAAARSSNVLPLAQPREAPTESKPNYAWAWALAGLAIAAIAVGFFVNSSGSNSNQSPVAEAAAPSGADGQLSTASGPVQAEPSAEPAPMPVATPIVVRVEIAPVQPENSSSRGRSAVVLSNDDIQIGSKAERAPNDAEEPAPPKPARAVLADYKLDGIFYSNDPACVINDKILEPGQRVNGLTVKKIEKTYVVVEINGQEFDLRQ